VTAHAMFDFLKYAGAPVTWAAELLSGSQTPTAWTYSRMAMAHPNLTAVYNGWAIGVMVLIQVPLLIIWLLRRPARDSRMLGTAAILVGIGAVNGFLYASTAAIDAHIRYGMPAYLLLQVLLLWCDLLLLADLAPELQRARATKHRMVALEDAAR